MKAKRIAVALVGTLLLADVALVTMGSVHELGAESVGISTAISVQRGCSTDCGKADEPTSAGIVACGWAVDDLPESLAASDADTVSDDLVSDCDYRVTGEACQEDELCALEQIRETGAFGR